MWLEHQYLFELLQKTQFTNILLPFAAIHVTYFFFNMFSSITCFDTTAFHCEEKVLLRSLTTCLHMGTLPKLKTKPK